MSHMLVDYIKDAYHSLTRNRGRSVLTTLGIAIGIASVTCILALSGGVTSMINQQVDTYSGDLAIVRPGLQTRDPNALTNPVAQQSFSTSTLTEADVVTISQIAGVEAAVPLMTIDGTLKSTTDTVENNVVLATTPAFTKVASFEMKSGQFIDDETATIPQLLVKTWQSSYLAQTVPLAARLRFAVSASRLSASLETPTILSTTTTSISIMQQS